jgi:hypothetical protein
MLHCPDCGRDKVALATDGATPMCAECPGASGDGVEMVDDGMTEADLDAAHAAYDEMVVDRRDAFREALTKLLNEGPDAVDAAEDRLRSRMDNEGCNALSMAVEVLHPEHVGIYWARESDGFDA